MSFILQPLRVGSLSNLEAGQLINRHLTDLGTLDAALLTDVPYNTYITALTNHSSVYTKALEQLQKNEDTKIVADADSTRDWAISAFNRSLKLYSISDDPEEVEASRRLTIIFKNFKNISKLNYEAESQAIDKLLIDLAQPEAVEKINRLAIERWVTRMKTANDAFKALFGTRIQTEAFSEVYDMKTVRTETFQTYSEYCKYVLSMAKATNGELFAKTLNLVNAARSYYADLLARRKSAGQKKG